MKILLYTQQTSFGGSTRLLLNLAQYLSLKHDVIVSFPGKINSNGVPLFEHFPQIKKIARNYLIENNYQFDVGLFHLPYIIDNSLEINCSRKIAVVMEIASELPIIINNSNIDFFDQMIYLHDDQIRQFHQSINEKKLIKLRLINNIDYQPSYHKTCNIGCVGSTGKHNFQKLLKVMRSSKYINQIIIYSYWRSYSYWRRSISVKIFGIVNYIWLEIFYRIGKIEFRGTELEVEKIYQSFDCLLHTPSCGNGTSVVVSDALASGKYVVLSSLPEYKQAYSNLEGVFFLDEIGYDLTSLIKSYDKTTYKRILDNYQSVYDRTAILSEWENVITDGSIT